MSGEAVLTAAKIASLVLSAGFITYWCFIVISYLRRRPQEPGDPAQFDWHFFVPCRDEAAVIGETLAYLRQHFPDGDVWVIDDDSDDDTAAIVDAFARTDDGVHLVRRHRPDARTGKGDALNAAYRALVHTIGPDVDLDRVIVGVVDADGRPSPGCLAACAGAAFFGDPHMGGVQVEVRIGNVDDPEPVTGGGRWANALGRTLLRMQDLEFRTVIGAVQTSRRRTRTVGLGGNGQFTRLSALRALDEGDGRAWRGSLLEDFELGLHLLLAGYSTAFCPDAWVDQEGLPTLDRYLTQRTRWGQGVMQCMRYLGQVWVSPNLTTSGALELAYYLFQPWLTLLGTIVFPLPLIVFVLNAREAGVVDGFATHGGWATLLIYGGLGAAPFLLWGPMYRKRCAPNASRETALVWGIAYLLYVYGFYVTSWRAFGRIIRGDHSWSKTRRNAEFAPPAVPAPATALAGSVAPGAVAHIVPPRAMTPAAARPRQVSRRRVPAPRHPEPSRQICALAPTRRLAIAGWGERQQCGLRSRGPPRAPPTCRGEGQRSRSPPLTRGGQSEARLARRADHHYRRATLRAGRTPSCARFGARRPAGCGRVISTPTRTRPENRECHGQGRGLGCPGDNA